MSLPGQPPRHAGAVPRRGCPGSRGMGVMLHIPRRAVELYERLSQTCKQVPRISARRGSRACDPPRSLSPVAAAGTRLPGVEGELQVVHAAELVVHLEEGLDDGPDLGRHAIDLLVGHPLQLALQLLVEVEEATEPAHSREASVNLLVGRQYPVEYVADPVAGADNGVMHDQTFGTAHSCNSGAT